MKSIYIFIIFLSTIGAQIVTVQGVLRDNNNAAISDGLYVMSFEIFDSQSGGTSLWPTEPDEQNVQESENIVKYQELIGKYVKIKDKYFLDNNIDLKVVASLKEYYKKGIYFGIVKSVSEDERKSFIGWPPADGDEITKIIVSSLLDKELFNHMIEDLNEILVEMIEGIREKTQRVMEGGKMSSEAMREAFDEW